MNYQTGIIITKKDAAYYVQCFLNYLLGVFNDPL